MSEMTIPPAEPRCPDCSVCHGETEAHEDEFWCDDCRIGWPIENFHLEDGYRLDDPEIPQCDAEITPYADIQHSNIAHYRYRCIRNEGHDGEHAGLPANGGAGRGRHYWRNVRPVVTAEPSDGVA